MSKMSGSFPLHPPPPMRVHEMVFRHKENTPLNFMGVTDLNADLKCGVKKMLAV